MNAELYPLAETWVGIVADLYVMTCVQTGLPMKLRDCIVIEAGPAIFPPGEVRHPIRDIDIDAINSRGSDLADAFHIDFAPVRCVRTDPCIFFALGDPESRLVI